jgi:hypothetical protein
VLSRRTRMCNFLEYKGGFFSAVPNYYSHSPADQDMTARLQSRLSPLCLPLLHRWLRIDR